MTRNDADERRTRVPARHRLLYRQWSEAIIASFYEVYFGLRYGFLESVYARALERELVGRGLHIVREASVEVRYKGEVVGSFRADFLVESRIVLELKAGPTVSPSDHAQLLNYLRATDLQLGFLLHFGPRPTFKRYIHTR